ncbi:MAG: GDSL-type esterase/lipase family protein [Candidatus Metalachnospira sp.]|nr:GDSL-type esterase/lipase family protein [Candidatus Metalachnospira sp.]
MGKTIICFGDSLTYGYCADYGTDYVSLLRKQLKIDFPNADITVKNKGENGETSREGLRRLESDVLHYNPDIIIMLFGSNDSAFSDYQHRGIEEFSFNYDRIISDVKEKGNIQLILMTPPPVIEEPDMPFIENAVLNKYCDIIKEKAEKNGLMLIDLNKAFINADNGNIHRFMQWDGVHISSEGYRLFFETIYKVINPKIVELIKSE